MLPLTLWGSWYSFVLLTDCIEFWYITECVGLKDIPEGQFLCRLCKPSKRVDGDDGQVEQIVNQCTRIAIAPETSIGGCALCKWVSLMCFCTYTCVGVCMCISLMIRLMFISFFCQRVYQLSSKKKSLLIGRQKQKKKRERKENKLLLYSPAWAWISLFRCHVQNSYPSVIWTLCFVLLLFWN